MKYLSKNKNLVNQKGGLFHSSAGVARDRLFLFQNKWIVPELIEKSGNLIQDFGTTYDPNCSYLSPFELHFIILIPKHIAKHLAPKMDDQRRFIPEFLQWNEFSSYDRVSNAIKIFDIGEQIGKGLQAV